MSAKKTLKRLREEGPTPNPYQAETNAVMKKLKAKEAAQEMLSDKPKKK